jgi:hypothetical protein
MKPRKKWEPEYRFGGDKSSWYTPAPLGEGRWRTVIKKPKTKKGKK